MSRSAMGYNMAGGASNMLKSGHSSASGLEEAVLKNIEAGKVGVVLRSSLAKSMPGRRRR